MKPRGIEKRVEQLRALREAGPTPQTLQTLKTALADRSNIVVAQAAKLAGELRLSVLIPDLIAAFEIMMEDGAARDPQCHAKNAIVDALTRMDHGDSAVFLRGARHVQMEAVWGKREDMAPPLRARCVLALAQCGDLRRVELLRHLITALTDVSDSVRTDAARALEQLGGDEAALLLRLKASVGDEEPRVVGQALESVLNIEGTEAVTFVSDFLDTRDADVFEEAALVLSSSRLPEAFAAVKRIWDRERNRPRGDALLRLIAASRRPGGIEFLLELIRDGSDRDAAMAAKSLEVHSESVEIQEQVREALKKRKKTQRRAPSSDDGN